MRLLCVWLLPDAQLNFLTLWELLRNISEHITAKLIVERNVKTILISPLFVQGSVSCPMPVIYSNISCVITCAHTLPCTPQSAELGDASQHSLPTPCDQRRRLSLH